MIAAVLVCAFVLLAGACLLAALILDVRVPRREVPRLARTALTREQEFAAAVGLTWRNWLIARAGFVVVALAFAWTTHVAFVDVLALVLGLVGPRLLLAGRAERRRIRQARAFVALLRQFASRLAVSNEPFDAILADTAANAPQELAFLRPAGGSRDVLTAVIAAIKESKSELLEKGLVTLLVSRTRDRITLAELLQQHQVPEIEALIDEAEEMRAVRSAQNATIVVLAGALGFMFAFLNGVPALHDFYSSAAGSIALVVVVAVFVTAVTAMKMLLRQPRIFHWDLDRVAADVGRIGGA